MSVHLRKYGVEATFEFPLVDFGATDYEATPVGFVAGDATTIKDGASDGNSDNDPAHITKGLYKIVVSATEMEAARIQVLIIDQTSPKAWEDQAITIETYGNASAQHAIDLDTALASATIGTCTTNTDMVGTAGAALASVVGALADAAAVGDPTEADTLMQYIKQLLNVLVGTTGIGAYPAEQAPANAVNVLEVLRAIYEDTHATQGKLPSSTYLKGSADADGGMDTNDKTDLESAVDAGMDNVPSSPTPNSRDARLESAGGGTF